MVLPVVGLITFDSFVGRLIIDLLVISLFIAGDFIVCFHFSPVGRVTSGVIVVGVLELFLGETRRRLVSY
jgi:hypothetical protein